LAARPTDAPRAAGFGDCSGILGSARAMEASSSGAASLFVCTVGSTGSSWAQLTMGSSTASISGTAPATGSPVAKCQGALVPQQQQPAGDASRKIAPAASLQPSEGKGHSEGRPSDNIGGLLRLLFSLQCEPKEALAHDDEDVRLRVRSPTVRQLGVVSAAEATSTSLCHLLRSLLPHVWARH
jgi:hypothetical protein